MGQTMAEKSLTVPRRQGRLDQRSPFGVDTSRCRSRAWRISEGRSVGDFGRVLAKGRPMNEEVSEMWMLNDRTSVRLAAVGGNSRLDYESITTNIKVLEEPRTPDIIGKHHWASRSAWSHL